MSYIRTKNRIYQVESTLRDDGFIKGYNVGEMAFIRKDQVINQSENLAELCDEFVFNSDVSNYVIDEKFIEHTKTIILKIYKENDETDYVKAMHPKFYGAIYTDKGLIYVAKMNESGDLELI